MTELEQTPLREFVYNSLGYLLSDAQLAQMRALPDDSVWVQHIVDGKPSLGYISQSKAEDFLRKCPDGWLLPSPLNNIWQHL